MKIEIDESDGSSFSELGTFQLLSVPYALFAKDAGNKDDADADPNNELQVLSISSDTIFLENGGFVKLPIVNVDDADADPANELQNLSLINDTLEISDGNKIVLPYDSSQWAVNAEKIYYNTGNVGIGSSDPISKLEVKSTAVSGALFQVINANNDTVFAVYPDGVKVFVDPAAKGKIGGFAVSGRTSTKGTYNDYLQVTKDSTRVYFSESGTKGKIGGFAVSGRTSTKGLLNDYFNVSGNENVETVDSDARILWYPKKEAFLTGRVLIESSDSVGTNSMTTGFESKAIGDYSQAMGYRTVARGDYSTAIGKNAEANGNSSFAFGTSTSANGFSSLALGDNAVASNTNSFAFGAGAQATSAQSLALGYNTVANGQYATSMGYSAVANGVGSTASGYQTQANSIYSFAGGYSSTANDAIDTYANYPTYKDGLGATAIGYKSEAKGAGALALGYMNKATAPFSAAVGGYQCTANEWGSSAFGDNSDAFGKHSIAMGYKAVTNGTGSVAIGNGSVAQGSYSYALGSGARTNTYASVSIGFSTLTNGSNLSVFGVLNDTVPNLSQSSVWVETEPLFMVGNGHDGVRSTAFTILKNGNTGIGTMSPTQKLEVNGSINLSGGDRSIDISEGYLDIRPHDASYGLILRDYTGNSSVWSSFRTIDAASDYLHIAMNSTSTGEGLVISDNGNVGIGAVVPNFKLEVNGSMSADYYYGPENNDYIQIDVNENFIYVANSAEKFRVDANGNVGIKTIPTHDLTISSSSTVITGLMMKNTTSTRDYLMQVCGSGVTGRVSNFEIWNTSYLNPSLVITASNYIGINTTNPGSYRFYVNGSAYSTGGWSSSDIKFKENILDLDDVINTLMKLRGVSFNWKTETYPDKGFEEGKHYGVIAQEVEKVLPDVIKKGPYDDLAVAYQEFIPILIEATKEQQEIIETQKNKIMDLEERLLKLEELLMTK